MTTPILVVDYDPAWPARFAIERAAIRSALGAYAVAAEHIGSTAVPGLATKPILDLAVVVPALSVAPRLFAPLAGLGYEYVPAYEAALPDRRYFRKGPHGGVQTHHLHMYAQGDAALERYLLFRDYLRAHRERAGAYATLKRALAAQYARDREGYTEAKSDFILETVALARAARGSGAP